MVKLYQGVKRDLTERVRHLQNSFEEYFPLNSNENNWLRNPFIGSFQMEDFSVNVCEQLIDIASDSVLKQKFPTISPSSFGSAELKVILRS
jgi:hypothetical protein